MEPAVAHCWLFPDWLRFFSCSNPAEIWNCFHAVWWYSKSRSLPSRTLTSSLFLKRLLDETHTTVTSITKVLPLSSRPSDKRECLLFCRAVTRYFGLRLSPNLKFSFVKEQATTGEIRAKESMSLLPYIRDWAGFRGNSSPSQEQSIKSTSFKCNIHSVAKDVILRPSFNGICTFIFPFL